MPAPPRRGLSGTRLFGGVLALVLVLLATTILVRQVTRPGGPEAGGQVASSGPAATPDPTRSAGGRTPGEDAQGRPSTGYTRMTPTDSRLYNVMYAPAGSSCRGLGVRRPPLPDPELITHLQQIVHCLHQLNSEALAAQDVPLSEPAVKGFQVQVGTPCGTLTRFAFYCPQDQTIYLDTRADDDRDFLGGVRMGYLAVMTHEYGHHLQLMGGISDGADRLLRDASQEGKLEVSRRVELQAACFSGVAMGTWWTSLGGTENDRTELAEYFSHQHDDATDQGTHGDRRSMQRWFDRGFQPPWKAYARCDTFSAPAVEVR